MKRLAMSLMACMLACGCSALLGVDFDDAHLRPGVGGGDGGSSGVVQCVPGCSGEKVCDRGQCSDSCSVAGAKVCDGNCTDVLNDENNCAFCNNKCPVPDGFQNYKPVCVYGQCSVTCVDGATPCGSGKCCFPPSDAGTFTPTTATAIATGAAHACAVTKEGRVACWGDARGGQLGSYLPGSNGTVADFSKTPVMVPGITSGATAVCAGGQHSCAIVGRGVKCWGINTFGELGSGNENTANGPVDVLNVHDATAIACGDSFTCALHSDTTVSCWGNGQFGAIGNAKASQYYGNPTPLQVDNLDHVVQIAVSGNGQHACALRQGGEVDCWGENGEGQVSGNGSDRDDKFTFVKVPINGTATSIGAGYMASCAVVGGAAECWGDNRYGQTAPGSDAGSGVSPSTVTASGITAVVEGDGQGCAFGSSQLVCWGRDTNGEMGRGTPSGNDHLLPGNVAHLDPSTIGALAAGGADPGNESGGGFTCALTKDGHVWCWGFNRYGQLGNPTAAEATAAPIEVQGL